jgi:hypothetical protein
MGRIISEPVAPTNQSYGGQLAGPADRGARRARGGSDRSPLHRFA